MDCMGVADVNILLLFCFFVCVCVCVSFALFILYILLFSFLWTHSSRYALLGIELYYVLFY